MPREIRAGLYEVAPANDFETNVFRIFDLGGRSVGVIRRPGGEFRALLNRCPHMAAPVCRGRVQGMFAPSEPDEYIWVNEGDIVMCPWHSWEYRIDDGAAASNITRTRLRTYAVEVSERGTVCVDIKAHGHRPARAKETKEG